MTELVIKSLAEDNRLDELVRLNMHCHDDVEDHIWLRMLVENPESGNPDFHKYLLADDKIVAATSLIPHKLRWYGSSITAGEIGLVGTHTDHRKKGYSTLLMDHFIDKMKDENIPLSFLWGIPGFYEKFHFHYAYPHVWTPYVSFPRSCADGLEKTGTIRPAETGDQWWIKKLYSAYNESLTGSHIRSDELWEWIFRLSFNDDKNVRWWVPEDPMGGYAYIFGDPPSVREIAAPSQNSLKNLVLGLLEKYPEMQNLYVCHHPDMPIGRWMFRWGARISSTRDIWKGTWGGMVRLIDPVACIRPMEPAINKRLQNSRYFRHTCEISIGTEIGNICLSIRDGEFSVGPVDGKPDIEIPASILTPCVTGYHGIDRHRDSLGHIPSDTMDILSVIFQPGTAYMYDLLYVDASLV